MKTKPTYDELLAMLKVTRDELSAAIEFFQEFVPLVDHKGNSLHEDWSWGPAEHAKAEADKILDRAEATP
ncbi:MAG: hypothetical protein Q8R02_23300 [Hyphomonadaceae bacterium]|nr:hypothetical protein [Hyphomonadaceae bacterium]